MDILIVILPLILEVIKICVENYGEEVVAKRIKAHGPLVQWLIYIAARKNGCDRMCAIQHVKDACVAIDNMTDADISALISEAKS